MKYFKNCENIESARKLHRKLVKENHPDTGGDIETMQTINAEFDEFCTMFTNAAFKEFTGSSNNAEFAGKIGAILRKMAGWDVTCEIIGSWLYVFNSFAYKDELKSMNFWYSKKHKAWVYNGRARMAKNRTRYNLNQIRSYHGSTVVETEKLPRIS